MLNDTLEFMRANRGILLVAFLALSGWLYLRTVATPLDSIAALDERLGRGRPVVLEFFANT